MTCSDCGRTNPPEGFARYADQFPVCANRADCRIAQRESAKAPDKLLRKTHAAEIPGLFS